MAKNTVTWQQQQYIGGQWFYNAYRSTSSTVAQLPRISRKAELYTPNRVSVYAVFPNDNKCQMIQSAQNNPDYNQNLPTSFLVHAQPLWKILPKSFHLKLSKLPFIQMDHLCNHTLLPTRTIMTPIYAVTIVPIIAADNTGRPVIINSRNDSVYDAVMIAWPLHNSSPTSFDECSCRTGSNLFYIYIYIYIYIWVM